MSDTPTPTITWEQIEAEVRRLAAERPDFVYVRPETEPRCMYWHEAANEPGCIFGHALYTLGVPVDRLVAFDHMPQQATSPGYPDDWYSEGITNVVKALGVNVTDEQEGWAKVLQERQDSGDTWGAAIEFTDDDDEPEW
jgi:hypothetical protein